MADTSRIDELRRRVQRDPASIAFAQLAEEYRRAGRYQEAIETCEQGLAHHPGYLSARVTLGRSYLELNELDAAQIELNQVLRAAPENLAALRGMAEIHHRRGELQQALAHYRTALEFARTDPELQHLVEEIAKELEPRAAAPAVADGMSFEDVKNTFLNLSLPDNEVEGVSVETAAAPAAVDAEPAVATVDLTAGSEHDAFAWPGHDEAPVQTRADAEEEPSWHAAPEAIVPELAASPYPVVAVEAAAAVPVVALALPSVLPDFADAALSSIDSVQVVHDLQADTLTVTLAEGLPPGVAPADALPPDAASPATPPAPSDEAPLPPATVAATPGDGDAAAQVDALERWLETIIADRQRRA